MIELLKYPNDWTYLIDDGKKVGTIVKITDNSLIYTYNSDAGNHMSKIDKNGDVFKEHGHFTTDDSDDFIENTLLRDELPDYVVEFMGW